MRQHPLLAFATAATALVLTLFGVVGSAAAATTTHPSGRSTTAVRSTLLAGTSLASTSALAAMVAPVAKTSPKVTEPPKRESQRRRVVEVSKHVIAKVSIKRHLVVPLGGVWSQLRSCESGGNYRDDTGNGYYGAYQFALSTWRGLRLGGLPSSASPQIQDAAAVRLQKLDGWGPWPRCSWSLGLRA
jgi:Transglycosylase-like domain